MGILKCYNLGAAPSLCSATERSRLLWTAQGAQVSPRNQEAKHELGIMAALQFPPGAPSIPSALRHFTWHITPHRCRFRAPSSASPRAAYFEDLLVGNATWAHHFFSSEERGWTHAGQDLQLREQSPLSSQTSWLTFSLLANGYFKGMGNGRRVRNYSNLLCDWPKSASRVTHGVWLQYQRLQDAIFPKLLYLLLNK